MFFITKADNTVDEYSVPGTYKFYNVTSGYYPISLVGGGAGSGAFDARYYGGWSNWTMACGGSGAYFKGSVFLERATEYVIVVGSSGTAISPQGISGNGGDTYLMNYNTDEIIVRAGGGKGAGNVTYLGEEYIGKGGTVDILNSSIVTSQISKNGIDGPWGTGAGQANSVYDNTTTGYGAGGYGWADGNDHASVQNGLSGYASITFSKANYKVYGITHNSKMYVPITKRNAYYKYVNKNWVQPILTQNGTMGLGNFAVSQSAALNGNTQAYKCFNNDITNIGEGNRWQINSVNTSTEYYIYWYNPTPLLIQDITVYNSEANYVVKNYVLYGSDDNNTWTPIVSGTNTVLTSKGSWKITVKSPTKGYRYHRLGCKPNSGSSLQIMELQLNAKEQYVVDGSQQDYDYIISKQERYY